MELPAQLFASLTLLVLVAGALPDILRDVTPRRPRVHGVLPRGWPGA